MAAELLKKSFKSNVIMMYYYHPDDIEFIPKLRLDLVMAYFVFTYKNLSNPAPFLQNEVDFPEDYTILKHFLLSFPFDPDYMENIAHDMYIKNYTGPVDEILLGAKQVIEDYGRSTGNTDTEELYGLFQELFNYEKATID